MRNFFLIMLVCVIVMFVPMKVNSMSINQSNFAKEVYDEAMTDATKDAARQLLVANDDYSMEIQSEGEKENILKSNLNLDKALDRFYRTLYIDLNIQNSKSSQAALKYKIPIIIATGYDGYYMYYWNNDGKKQKWSDKKLYSTVDNKNNLIINFTLDDYVYITNLNNKSKVEGYRKDLASKYPNSCLKDEQTFNKVKSQIINQLIKKDLEHYTYYSNVIARRNNWGIKYNLPYWGDRSVDSVSFMAFVQGEVFEGANDKYDSYGFATTKLKDKKAVYGYTKNNKKLYSHKKAGNDIYYFENEYEAAKNGYSPDLENYK